MASINDLATAATIASSAVALQTSPTQDAARPAPAPAPAHSTPPRSPPPPTAGPATATAAAATTGTGPRPTSSGPEKATDERETEDGDSITVATGAPVLAAPRISPQNPSQAQIPVPPPPAAATGPATAVDAGVANGKVDDDDAMDGVEMTAATATAEPVRGAFIVFEGMDRAGKTTQAKLLQQRCIESGRDVQFLRFPDRTTPIGKMIDSYLKGEAEIEDHVIHLLFSANRWEAVKKIQAELEAGHTIICDRFYHSGIVYSAAKNIKSLSLSWAKAPEVGLPRPDMVLFLDLEEQVARERGGWGGEVYEKGEMQRRVRDLFWGLSMGDLGSAVGSNSNSSNNNNNGSSKAPRKDVERNGAGRGDTGGEDGEFRQEEEDIQIVDADLGVEELSEKVWEVVLPRLQAVERGEVGRIVRTVR
ncbi:thymidylate kinase-domain-containing protein [Hypoxylon sp. NC1633]|nr:thymidylate kinase-domain-containing protein [Hypoxylon sp. NC1633]